MATVESYLFFDGKCAEAMRFYERALGGKIETLMTYGEAPEEAQCPAGAEDRIMHARLSLDGGALMASDTPPGHAAQPMQGFSISLFYPSAQEARRIFDALADGGKVMMPLGKTFWSEAFGMLTDRFGTPWMVSGGEMS